MYKKWKVVACAFGAIFPLANAIAATDVSAVVAAAQSTDADYQADTLLRVIAQQQADQGASWPVDRAGTVAMLENIYALGFKVPDQLPNRPVASAEVNRLVVWLGTPLDRVSLQMAAATSMAMLDVTRATAMFARDEKLKASVAPCGSKDFEDYSPVYRVAATLLSLQTAPNPKFVEERFDRAHSATALAPVFEMASRTAFTAAQYRDIVRWGSDALNRIQADDQAFTATLPEVAAALAEFRTVLDNAGVDQTLLKTAYAAYLTNNLTGQRCPENVVGSPLQIQNAIVESLRDDLNLTVATASALPDGAAVAENSISSLAVLANQTVLAITGDGTSSGQLSGTALTQQVVSLLNAIDTVASQQDDAEFSVYEARLSALLAYLDVAPLSAERTRAQQTVTALVSNAALYQQQNHAGWLDGTKRLLASMAAWPDGSAWLNALVSGSSNAVLRNYGRMAQLNMLAQPSTLSK